MSDQSPESMKVPSGLGKLGLAAMLGGFAAFLGPMIWGKRGVSARERYRHAWWDGLHPAERWARRILGSLFAAINRGSGRVTHWMLEPPQETTPEELQEPHDYLQCGVDEEAA